MRWTPKSIVPGKLYLTFDIDKHSTEELEKLISNESVQRVVFSGRSYRV